MRDADMGLADALADVLERATDNVRAGWTQHQLFDHVDGTQYCCASGAIWLACGLTPKETEGVRYDSRNDLWYRTYRHLSDFVGEDLPSWNDALGRTQAEVVDAMLHLAKELRNTSS